MIRVILAEDHETVRQGLKLLIDGQPDMEVVGEAGDGAAAIRQVAALKPDVAVLDIAMPEVNGLAAAREIRAAAPGTRVVALTRYTEDAYVQELLSAGASAYVLKQSSSRELLAAIRAAAAGRLYLDEAFAAPAARPRPRGRGVPPPRVSNRESDVLRLMALGHSNKEIAAELGVSVKTVEVHKTNAMHKLNMTGRVDVVKYAMLQGWLKDP